MNQNIRHISGPSVFIRSHYIAPAAFNLIPSFVESPSIALLNGLIIIYRYFWIGHFSVESNIRIKLPTVCFIMWLHKFQYLCSEATSFPPPTHSPPMNTRGTLNILVQNINVVLRFLYSIRSTVRGFYNPINFSVIHIMKKYVTVRPPVSTLM